jgi:hypothetical protein
MQNPSNYFDAWEELYKARKAKGLAKWGRLQKITHKLGAKQSKDITFTCCHPKHGASGDTHNLGSSEGNLHFLLGYVNPGFALAPYHWHIIYPDLSEDELRDVTQGRRHPAQPVLWATSKLPVEMEGDDTEGTVHPFAFIAKKRKDVDLRSIKVDGYVADPKERVVYDQKNNAVYKWELIQDSLFAGTNPEIAEAMSVDLEEASAPEVPEIVKHLVTPGLWASDVYPLVKSLFPVPGSVISIPVQNETVYALVKSNELSFVDAVGQQVSVEIYDTWTTSLSLTPDVLFPTVIFDFGVKYLGIDPTLAKSTPTPVETLPSVVSGFSSPGFDNVPACYTENMHKSVVRDGHTSRLVVTTK